MELSMLEYAGKGKNELEYDGIGWNRLEYAEIGGKACIGWNMLE